MLIGVLARASFASPADDVNVSQLVQTYCAGCHNGTMRSPSNGVLDRFDTTTIARNPDIWSRAYRQLQAGTMPPFGAPRPDRGAYATLLSSIETALDATSPPPADATDQEIAERLATLLWNSAPDAALLSDARLHRLTQAATLEKQIQRMLADDRADALVSRFFFPWLGLDQLVKAEPDTKFFPDYTVALRDAMATETDFFLRSQVRDDNDPIALWTANYTFLNEPLARHYGISGVTGAQFRRVALSTPERNGLFGQGSILMVTSRHQPGHDIPYTSPAARATWVRMHFLGAPVPQPFPGALPVKPDLPITPQTRALPAQPCVNCHQNFFPLGYALEHFDPIGEWRENDQIGPVDASGAFVDGTPTNGSVALRKALLQYSEAFRTTITERLLIYAAGKSVSATQPTPQTLVRARQVLHAAGTPRWSSLIAAIVRIKPPVERVAVSTAEQTALVKTYCAVCHTDAAKNGGLSLEHYDAGKRDPALAAMILSKLNNGAMGAAGKGVPDQEVQQAWLQATRQQAVGATEWFVSRDNGVVSASIVREVAPRRPGSSDRPVYRLNVTCNPSTRAGDMQLTWSPVAQTGRALTASVDGNSPIEYRIDGTESMGNGNTGHSGHASVALSEGKGARLDLASRSLTIRELFPGETVEFPVSDLDRWALAELRTCF
jgi:mono/diheme cytochrome c family protein